MTEARRTRFTGIINRRLLEWELPTSEATIGVYAAIGSEVTIDLAIEHWLMAGHRVVWPRVESEENMVFCSATPSELISGAMGIQEPSPEQPVTPIDAIDLLIVPGIGFDRFGGRLGQGGGYYDRALSGERFRGEAIGVAFAVQIVSRIPLETTDRRVDGVITERGVARGGQWSL